MADSPIYSQESGMYVDKLKYDFLCEDNYRAILLKSERIPFNVKFGHINFLRIRILH